VIKLKKTGKILDKQERKDNLEIMIRATKLVHKIGGTISDGRIVLDRAARLGMSAGTIETVE